MIKTNKSQTERHSQGKRERETGRELAKVHEYY